MHPIDVVAVNETTSQGVTCVGAIGGADNSALMIGVCFLRLSVPTGNSGSPPRTLRCADWLLGDSFLRNVYQLYGYGNSSAIRADPYIKLYSVRRSLCIPFHHTS